MKKDAESLFILGDLFDFWWEYKTVIPKAGIKILFAMKDLIQYGIKVYYLPGNHDFSAKRLFEEIGVIVQEKLQISLNGKPVFLMHGDLLDNSFLTSLSRIAYRSFLSRSLFSLLHPNFAIPLARLCVGISGGSGWVNHLEEKFKKFAEEKIGEGFYLVGLAHIHRPALEKIGNGYYLNTGDWLKNFSYGVLDSEEIRLARWE